MCPVQLSLITSSVWKLTFGIEMDYSGLFCTLLPPEKVSLLWRIVCFQPSLGELQRNRRLRLLASCLSCYAALCCFGRSPGVSVSLWEKQPLNPTEPLFSLPNGSAGCCNLFSAWPDYCLLHIVWWRASGSTGEGDSALICCYIRKITFLLMYPSGHELCLVVCRLCFQKEL